MNVHSFCLTSNHSQNKQLDLDTLKKSFSANRLNLDEIRFASQTNNALNVSIVGPNAACLHARGDILRNNPVKSAVSITSPNMDAMYHPEIKRSLIEIAKEYSIDIKIDSASEPEIHMVGAIDSVELARVKVLVLLDQLSGLHIDTLEDIPYYLHFLLAGRKHVQLQSIMEETSTNIYLQSPFGQLCQQSPDYQEAGTIYLTGDSTSGLNRAKDVLRKLTAQKIKSMYHKDSTMQAKKLDWILLYKRDELRKIMRDNGSFFMFPALGSGSSSVSIYAENRIYVERSIRLLNYLASSIYEATFDLVETDSLKDEPKLPLILSGISQSSGADVTYQPQFHRLQLFGTEHQVIGAYRLLSEISLFNENHQFAMFSLELATDQQEFVSGKKNGKINKIMKTCSVSIRFTFANEYNSSIVVESTNHAKALEGLTMLQDELPAETSFYVPEVYHRRIIGVAGKNIQKVMKKYGVYVKFSSAEEFASLGGYFENEDNVVARTPMKNKMNLEHLKHSVTEFIGFQKDKDFVLTTLTIPYALQRIIPYQYGSQLRDVCRANNAKVWWPERLGSDQVSVYGPQAQIAAVISFLTQFVAKERQIAVVLRGTNEEDALTNDSFISILKHKINTATQDVELLQTVLLDKLEFKNDVLEWVSCYRSENGKVVLFRFMCYQEQTLQEARDILKAMMEAKDIEFEEVTPTKYEATTTSQDIQTHLLPTSILSHDTYMSEDPILNMPSPPLTESYAASNHPQDSMDMPFIPSSASLLSAPFPTAKNIWASPRIQANNIVPPIVQMEKMNINYFPQGIQPPLSPPQQNTYNSPHSMMTMGSPITQHKGASGMRPLTYAPTVGTKLHQPLHHKSWPDVFFGGRDLFDTLPSRRVSASTQYAFELHPNNIASNHSSPSMQSYPKMPMTNKYQVQFDHIVQTSPFLYSNAPQMNGPNMKNNTADHHSYSGFNI